MTLSEFRELIEAVPDHVNLSIGISYPFSWRGDYQEVAFSFEHKPMSKAEYLKRIDAAKNGTFEGYKGGEYEYDDDTHVNFEEDIKNWSDGDYLVKTLIQFITYKTIK